MAETLVQPERTLDVEQLWRQNQQVYGLLSGQADWASDVHLLEDVTIGGTLVVGSTLTLVDLVVTQNSILGDTAGDTVTVNATSTFGADVAMNGGLTVGGSATFGNVNATGNVTLGNAAGDALTVNATGTFLAPVTFNGTLAAAATSVTTLTASSTVQGTRLISTVAPGTAPLTVASTTVVPNLNASLLGGHPVSDFALVAGAYLDASGTGQTKAGALTIQGTFTTEGNTVVGNASTDTLTVAATPTFATDIVLSAAASRVVPGATSFAIRNNADGADNLLVTNAGSVTVRNGLTVTTGGATVSSGDLSLTNGYLIMGVAASRIVPGGTSLSLRNNARGHDLPGRRPVAGHDRPGPAGEQRRGLLPQRRRRRQRQVARPRQRERPDARQHRQPQQPPPRLAEHDVSLRRREHPHRGERHRPRVLHPAAGGPTDRLRLPWRQRRAGRLVLGAREPRAHYRLDLGLRGD
jgi:hypothetical protein